MATPTWPEYLAELSRYLASVERSIASGDPALSDACPTDRPETLLPEQLRETAIELFAKLETLARQIEDRLEENGARRRALGGRLESETRPRHFSGLL